MLDCILDRIFLRTNVIETRISCYNFKTRLVDLIWLFWFNQYLVDVGVLLIVIGLGLGNLVSLN